MLTFLDPPNLYKKYSTSYFQRRLTSFACLHDFLTDPLQEVFEDVPRGLLTFEAPVPDSPGPDVQKLKVF